MTSEACRAVRGLCLEMWRGFEMADDGIQHGKEGCTEVTKLI